MYRRDGLHFCSERVVDCLQGSLLEVNVSEVIVHEGDEPYAVVDLLYADTLTREHGGDVDFFPMHADPAAGGYQDLAIMEGIIDVWQAVIDAR